MSNENKPSSGERRIVDWPWAVLMSFVGVLTLGAAYSLGDAYYVGYLRNFSIDDGAFPIDRSKHLVLAVWGALNASIGFQKWVNASWKPLVKAGIVLLVYFAVIVAAHRFIETKSDERRKATQKVSGFLASHPGVRRYLKVLGITIFIVYNVVTISIFFPTFLAIPSGIGGAASDIVAAEHKEDFARGCAKSARTCYRAIKDDKEIANGYIVAQSPTRVALYESGSTIQIPLEGIELRTVSKPRASAPLLPSGSDRKHGDGAAKDSPS